MLEFVALLIVLGLAAYAVIGLAIVVYRVVVVIVTAVTGLFVAGGAVWIVFQILWFFAQNPQYFE